MLLNYAVALEKLALKKSSFDETLQDSGFTESNQRNNFMNKDNPYQSFKNVETSIDKLRIKFKSFIQELSKIRSSIKNGSALAPEKEPHRAGQTSFVRNKDDDDQEDISNDGGQKSDVDIGEENIQDYKDATTLDTGETQETNKQKIGVAPYKQWQQVRSNKQALSEVANSLKVMAETSLRHFKVTAEEDKRREGRYMAFQREKARKKSRA